MKSFNKLKTKTKVLIILGAALIILAAGRYAIGPRTIESENTGYTAIYYMGDVYECVTAYPGEVETGRFVGFLNPFEDVYRVKGDKDLLYKRSFQQRYLYKKLTD